jgi:hypothetical protein
VSARTVKVAAALLLIWAAWLHLDGPNAADQQQQGGGPPRLPQQASTSALLSNPRLELSAPARADLRAGRVDPRLVRVLAGLLSRHRLTVSVIRSGHAKYVAGTRRVSLHWSGRAADIARVDGGRVRAGHRPSQQAVAWLAGLPSIQRPAEVGSPFARFSPLPGFFTDADHRAHIHIGVP